MELRHCVLACLLPLACADDEIAAVGSHTESSIGPDASGTATDATATTTGTAEDHGLDPTIAGDPTLGLPDPVCGDGNVDAGEACDSGAANGQPGFCNEACTGATPYCGDGNLDPGETCDDGNPVDGDGCDCPGGSVWEFVDPEQPTRIYDLEVTADGGVLAIGERGPVTDPVARVWRLGADGQPVPFDDSFLEQDGSVGLADITRGDDGRLWMFGTDVQPTAGLVYRVDGDDVTELLFPNTAFGRGVLLPVGAAVSTYLDQIAAVDDQDQLAWTVPADPGYAKGMVYDPADDTFVVLIQPGSQTPPTLSRYGTDGSLLDGPVAIGVRSGMGLARLGDNLVMAGYHDDTAFVRLLDHDFTELWLYERPQSRFWDVTTIGATIVAAGNDTSLGATNPYAAWLDVDGNLTSERIEDAVAHGFEIGGWSAVITSSGGGVYFGGVLTSGTGANAERSAYVLGLLP